MTQKLDRTQLIDQLEQLKKGLSAILLQQQAVPSPDPPENGHQTVVNQPTLEDAVLLQNFEVIRTSRDLLATPANPQKEAVDVNREVSLILTDHNQRILAFTRTSEVQLKRLSSLDLSLQQSLFELLPVIDEPDFKQLYRLALEGHPVYVSSDLSRDKEPHQWFEISLFPVSDPDQKIHRIVWCLEDVEARITAQANLQALEINFQSVFTQAAVSVVLSNTDLEVIQANEKFYEMVEYSAEEYQALPPWSITHPKDLAESKRLMDLLRTGEIDSFSLEQRIITKTGKILWVYLTTNIIRNSRQDPIMIVSVAQDITDRKHAEQELIYKTNELDTFVYRASHDLRGPVASLLGLYNVVQIEFKDDTHAMEYFGHYHQSVVRLNKILQNLIDLTKIKEREIQPSELDLKALISDCLTSISHVANFEKIHFKVNNEVGFKVRTDQTLMRTIIYNLLENSVNFMQVDNPRPFIKVNLKYESNFLIIEVADNGQGIKKELQTEVFNMFYRANENSSGSGLGLYIVRNAVEKLNGSIQLKSKVMSGTKITIYIPYIHKSIEAKAMEQY